MFEMTDIRSCGNCRWFEVFHITRTCVLGTCQCYDEVKKDYQYCCRHRFTYEEVYDDKK